MLSTSKAKPWKHNAFVMMYFASPVQHECMSCVSSECLDDGPTCADFSTERTSSDASNFTGFPATTAPLMVSHVLVSNNSSWCNTCGGGTRNGGREGGLRGMELHTVNCSACPSHVSSLPNEASKSPAAEISTGD